MERYTRCLSDDSSNLVSAVLLSTGVSQLGDSGQRHLCTGQVLLAVVWSAQCKWVAWWALLCVQPASSGVVRFVYQSFVSRVNSGAGLNGVVTVG